MPSSSAQNDFLAGIFRHFRQLWPNSLPSSALIGPENRHFSEKKSRSMATSVIACLNHPQLFAMSAFIHIVRPFILFFGCFVSLLDVSVAQNKQSLSTASVLISSRTLDEKVTIEAAFPAPMVEDNAVGQVLEIAPVKITPAWKGKWIWESPRIAKFEPSESPKLGTTYEFSVKSALKDLAGKRVPLSGTTASAKVPSFSVDRQTVPMESSATRRQSPMLLLFNAPVSAKSMKDAFLYTDSEGKKVLGQWRYARWSEMSEETRGYLTLGRRIVMGVPSLSGDEIPEQAPGASQEHAVVVWPTNPLPAGQKWKLTVSSGVAADDGSKASLTRPAVFNVGDILPGKVLEIRTYAPVDDVNSIEIAFDKRLLDDKEAIRKLIAITPTPSKAPEIEVHGMTVVLSSPHFQFQKQYTVAVESGIPAWDGLPIESGMTSQNLTFPVHPPTIALPSSDEVQLANGHGNYPIECVNVSGLHITVKEISADNLPRLLLAYENYKNGLGDSAYEEENSPHTRRTYGYPMPKELVVGNTVYDETVNFNNEKIAYQTNKTSHFPLEWKNILKEKRPVALFIEVTASGHEGSQSGRMALSQAVVQLTNLGIAWKCGTDDMCVYVFSHSSAAAVPDVEVTLQTRDGQPLASVKTDEKGVVRLPLPEKDGVILVKQGKDLHATTFSPTTPIYSPWRIGATEYDWNRNRKKQCSAEIFTERNLYRPGETVHLAGFVRGFKGSLPVFYEKNTAKLIVYNGQQKAFHNLDVALSAHGHFTANIPLPAGQVGSFNAVLQVPNLENDASPHTFSHYFSVDEFRRNAFEIQMPAPDALIGQNTVTLPITATYLMGAPVAKAAVRWSVHFRNIGFYPESGRDYVFADHRTYDGNYWDAYYGGSRYEEAYVEESEDAVSYANGEAELDSAGFRELTLQVPECKDFPAPRNAYVHAEITDANQQTLSTDHDLVLHPADFYLGLRRPQALVRAGESLNLDAIALTPDGKPFKQDIEATLLLEKEVWNTVEVRAAGGGMEKRNESHFEELSKTPLAMTGGKTPVVFSLPETGEYHVSLMAQDAGGRPVRTTLAISVVGDNYYAWEGENGERIDLLPDKKRYLPGETARILVKTPLEGMALVTVERDSVERVFTQKLTGSAPVIEIPLTDADAPNIYVGVMVVEGTDASQLKFPMPRAKFGYTRLAIEQRLPKLNVAIKPARPSVRPGAEATVEVKVTDHSGQAVPSAAVVLYAVDDGVLSVMGYDNPDLVASFHPARLLGVHTSATFGNILAEDPENLSHYNKGYVIGGGGEMPNNFNLRSDFSPCAYWSGELMTDHKGVCTATFKTPDTLTRYRIVAVAAAKDGWRFGTGSNALEVTKPLMIEPSTPRFANVGDMLKIRALVLNQSPCAGVFSVVLQPDSLCALESTPRAEVSLAAGESKPVEFTVRFTGEGKTKWTWQASPVRIEGQLPPELEGEMTDSIESTFAVMHPIPVLKEVFAARMNSTTAEIALLDTASAYLREGEGTVTVTVANTRLVEAINAAQALMVYPYGCIEQTSSSLSPWLMVNVLREFIPGLPDKETVEKTVDAGIARLVSMQTSSGGLAYWPGQSEPNLWGSVHAASVLWKASKAGYNVPETLMTPLLDYLAAQIPGIMELENSYDMAQRVNAIAVLARAGRPDWAYMNRLFDARQELSEDTILQLALAYSSAPEGQSKARELLAQPTAKQNRNWWYPNNGSVSLRLLASMSAGMSEEEILPQLDALLASRSMDGAWGSTYTNAHALEVLMQYHNTYEKNLSPAKIRVTWDGKSKEVVLDAQAQQAKVTFALSEITPQSRPVAQYVEGSGNAYLCTELAARPRTMPRKAASPAFRIDRRYQTVQPDGSLSENPSYKVGDLVAVTLQVQVESAQRYVVIDDPLPSSLEAVNPEFTSQAGARVAMANVRTWVSDFTEMRDSRVLFFCDNLNSPGAYTLTYLARVTKAGSVLAPPSKMEAMYDATLTALGEGTAFTTNP